MRVVHIDCGREMRGGQWQVLRLIEGLSALGVESALLAPKGSPLAARARALCEVRAPHLLNVARRYDIVHAHDARAHTLAALAARGPLIVARRVAFPPRSRWKYGRATRYIAVSEFVKRVLVRSGVPEDKISVVYDGVPLLPPTEGGTLVVAPAYRDDPQKGLALAGVPVHYSADLEADLPRAAMFVYLTHSEGLGSGALLAMSAGVPVVASRTGGLPEIVRHMETGLLVDNTAESAAAAIALLRADPDLARRLGAAARRAVQASFSTEAMVRRTLEVYRQVLS